MNTNNPVNFNDMTTRRDLMRTVVQLIAAFMALVLGFGIYASIAESRADQKAKDFCNSIRIGRQTTGLLEEATGAQAEPRYLKWYRGKNEYENDLLPVVFAGATPLSRHICNIEAKNEKVISASYRYLD